MGTVRSTCLSLAGAACLTLAFGLTALAATPPASCDSGHGVFGVFAHHNATVPEAGVGPVPIPFDAREDRGLGHATGPNNSGFSQACRLAH